uniref:ABC1 atypical kinase-like domain-containing protein n=1 Tax=Ananas comosus var. bracteatus TaxID=296719 RepID=A0A6V7Q8H5_ANACO|nr:unnamed protein product [Ananas comosus var. bracteatus]
MRKFSVYSSSGGSMGNYAQVAWKQLSVVHSCRVRTSRSISKIACAMSLAATRSHLVPYIFAFIGGELVLTQKTSADGDYFPTSSSIYMRAQDGRIYFTSLIFYVVEFIILLLRSIYLATLFSPIIVMAPFADALGSRYRRTWLILVHRTLEKAGPAFIKWGQWAATRPDLFPGDLCSELSKLHTKAPAHSFAYTKKTIEKAFSRKISDIFENFEEEPVASGSVAQVHRASLRFRYPGQQTKRVDVAVKVRHPGVGESIRRDFAIINTVAKISNFIPTLKWLRLDESVQQFAVFMMSQVDLAREAAHLSRESVSYYVDALEGHDRLKSALAHIGTHALLKMLLVDNFVHADMHPGNILVPVALRDGRTAAECTLRLSKQQNCPNPKAFVEEVEKSFTFWGTAEGDAVHPAECMHKLLEQVRRHKVNIDGNVCTVMVTTLVLEGWQRKLDPDYNVMRTLQTLLFKSDWAKSLQYTIEGLMAP